MHPGESLIEFIRAMQELIRRAMPNASEAEKRLGLPTTPPSYLHSGTYATLGMLAQQARDIEEHILLEREYMPPPLLEKTLKATCAWQGIWGLVRWCGRAVGHIVGFGTSGSSNPYRGK